ncbi:MAG: AgmX/PglI C-terminal domain-containing protein [Myxococcota bacterium]
MGTRHPEEKILRVGVIHAGRVVGERLLRKHEAVTVGSDPRCTVVLPPLDVPASLTLIEHDAGGHTLCFTDEMEGTISNGDELVPLTTIKQRPEVLQRGNTYRLRLGTSARGKVRMGEVTVLFQFVTPPRVLSSSAPPDVTQHGMVRNLDPVFASLVVGSLVFHFGCAAFLSTVPPPPAPSLEEVGERIIRHIAPNLATWKPPPRVERKTAQKRVEARRQREVTEKRSDDPATRKARLREAVVDTGLLKVLGKRGSGALADVFSTSSRGTDLAQLVMQAQGINLAQGSAGPAGPRETAGAADAAGIGVLDAPRERGHAAVALGSRREIEVRGAMQATELVEHAGELDPQVINRVIRARIAGFKACYENALKRNPNLKGKVTIGFLIDEQGGVADASVDEDTLADPEVARCVAHQFRRIRFPPPASGTVQGAFPFVFVPAN